MLLCWRATGHELKRGASCGVCILLFTTGGLACRFPKAAAALASTTQGLKAFLRVGECASQVPYFKRSLGRSLVTPRAMTLFCHFATERFEAAGPNSLRSERAGKASDYLLTRLEQVDLQMPCSQLLERPDGDYSPQCLK